MSLLATAACGEAPGDEGRLAAGGGSGSPAPVVSPLGRERCRAPAGSSGSPRTIAEAVALLNALPKPTSVACFVESLERPLSVFATNSQFSAQPAFSDESPRVFIQLGELWLSVVMDGDSSYLVELSELAADPQPRSLKGELLLPLEAPVAPSAPFERIRYGTGTICGLCHGQERPEPGISSMAFSSLAFRPRPETRIPLERLAEHSRRCDWAAERHRCELLSSVFDGGDVTEVPFPDSMATFY